MSRVPVTHAKRRCNKDRAPPRDASRCGARHSVSPERFHPGREGYTLGRNVGFLNLHEDAVPRDPETGRVFVRHEPNLPSGGQVADIEIGAFLIAAGNGPEKQEVLRLIGTLV
jgi:hypothetical protein